MRLCGIRVVVLNALYVVPGMIWISNYFVGRKDKRHTKPPAPAPLNCWARRGYDKILFSAKHLDGHEFLLNQFLLSVKPISLKPSTWTWYSDSRVPPLRDAPRFVGITLRSLRRPQKPFSLRGAFVEALWSPCCKQRQPGSGSRQQCRARLVTSNWREKRSRLGERSDSVDGSLHYGGEPVRSPPGRRHGPAT